MTGRRSGFSGARRSEKRVTARSKPCQKRCTGLVLPQNQPANSWNVQSIQRSARQSARPPPSYEACSVSSPKGVVMGIPYGSAWIATWMPTRQATRRAVVEGRDREPVREPNDSAPPRLVRTMSRGRRSRRETSKSRRRSAADVSSALACRRRAGRSTSGSAAASRRAAPCRRPASRDEASISSPPTARAEAPAELDALKRRPCPDGRHERSS